MSIKWVNSFNELVSTPLVDDINALCWPRTLSGDFNEIVDRLNSSEAITTLNESRLDQLPLSHAGEVARDVLIKDLRLLRNHGLSPTLDCIRGYPRDDADEIVPTDVYSFHADSSEVEAYTYLCTYTGAPSEGIDNHEAIRKIDLPETRATLLQQFGREDDDAFRSYLSEHCYDLHYAPLAHAKPFSFGTGNLWRIALQHPTSAVPPCIHRAPESVFGQSRRLLLIS
jgi:hypothetical protein